MLTRDLIRIRTEGTTLRPAWLDLERPAYLDLAGRLLELHRESTGATRAAIEEGVTEVVLESAWPKIVRGLAHVLTERGRFERIDREEFEGRRIHLFTEAAGARAAGTFDRTAVLTRSAAALDLDVDELETDLYRDLPDQARLLEPAAIAEPVELLVAYHDLLVASILGEARTIEFVLEGGEDQLPEPCRDRLEQGKLSVEPETDDEGGLHLLVRVPRGKTRLPRATVDWLGSVYAGVRSGSGWHLEAEVLWKRRRYQMTLP